MLKAARLRLGQTPPRPAFWSPWMPALEWSDALALDLALMDDTHREFVDLLARVEQADDARLLDAWRALVDHTQLHFDQEDRWMRETRFASGNCHSVQHQVVLQVMREGLARAEQGQPEVPRAMARELAAWFPQHAQSMDAALALHLRRVGHDPATGHIAHPDALPRHEISGCGGVSCTPGENDVPVAETTAA